MKIINGLSKAYDILNKTQKKYLIIIFFILIFTMLLEVFSLALIIPVSEAFFNEQNNIIINFKSFLNNFLSFTANYDFLTILVIFIIVFFIFKFFALIIMTIIQSKIIFKIFTEISERLLTKYLSLDLINYNKKTSGELTRNINSEPAVFISQFSINFVVLIKELLIFFGVIFFLLINSSSFTIFIISIALVFSLMFIFLTSNFQVKLAKNRFSNDGKRLSSIIQIINGFKIIKIFQLKDFFFKRIY